MRISWDAFQVTELPDGQYGRWTVEHITLTAEKLGPLGGVTFGEYLMGRQILPGTYVVLRDEERRPWMSDTPAEIGDHFDFAYAIQNFDALKVLITGCGLGVALKMAAELGVERADVVEIDADICRIGEFWAKELQDYIDIYVHHADARFWLPDKGMNWDVAWHDIWPQISDENIREMDKLRKRYSRYMNNDDAQFCWAEELARVELEEA